MTLGTPPSSPIAQSRIGDQAEEPQAVPIDVLHLRLPCRCFHVNYKVAEPGKFSLTTEFLLRLLRFADGLKEDAVAEFFGFTPNEVRFIIDHAERFGYVSRRSGRVYLTDGGNSLFAVGTDEPTLFEIQAKSDRFDFDLIALAPVERHLLVSKFEFELAELTVPDVDEAATASKGVARSLKRYFREFQFKRSRRYAERQILYTVDEVHPEKRFSTIVPITVEVRRDNPSAAGVNLQSWKSGLELEDRAAVIHSCASFIGNIRARATEEVTKSARRMAECAPEQVSRFIGDHGFDSQTFFRATVRQAGELRIDRPTARVVGNVWTEANRIRLASALRSVGNRGGKPPTMIFWLRPSLPFWGMTTRLPETLEAIVKHFAPAEAAERLPLRKVLIGADDWPGRFREVFNAIVDVPSDRLFSGLEVLLVPGWLAFVLVHTPVGTEEGYPVPLGIVSFDPRVIERAHALVSDMLAASYPESVHCDWTTDHLIDELDAALDFSISSEKAGG